MPTLSSMHGAASFLGCCLVGPNTGQVDVQYHDRIYPTALTAPMIADATAGKVSAERTWKRACWVLGGTNPRVTTLAYVMVG